MIPTERQIKRGDYFCRDCQREYDRKYRQRRREQGVTIISQNMPRKLNLDYEKTYYEQPHVKQRRAELARKYYHDPHLRHRHMDRLITRRAIKSGLLIKEPCEKCGNPMSESHHEDYYQPLKVRWLCKTHHREEHPFRGKRKMRKLSEAQIKALRAASMNDGKSILRVGTRSVCYDTLLVLSNRGFVIPGIDIYTATITPDGREYLVKLEAPR